MVDYNTDHVSKPSAVALVENLRKANEKALSDIVSKPFATHYRIDNDGSRTIVKPCAELEPVLFDGGKRHIEEMTLLEEHQAALEYVCQLLKVDRKRLNLLGPGVAYHDIEEAIEELKIDAAEPGNAARNAVANAREDEALADMVREMNGEPFVCDIVPPRPKATNGPEGLLALLVEYGGKTSMASYLRDRAEEFVYQWAEERELLGQQAVLHG